MVQYKVYYFNGKGRAEVARLLLSLAGQEFEDVRFERDVWPQHKEKMPFGQVPVLEVIDGANSFKLAQSYAIYRYLAQKYGFAGKNLEESAQIDAIADLVNDLTAEMITAHHEKDEAKKKELFQKFFGETIHGYLKHFQRLLGENKSGFLFGDGVTWADLSLFVIWDWIPEEPRKQIFSAYPSIQAHQEKVKELPKIAAWIAKRPVTEM